MLVEQTARDVAEVAVGVGNGHSVELYLIGDERNGLVLKVIACVEWPDVSFAVHRHRSYEVDVAEWSHEVQPSLGVSRYFAYEAVGERVEEVDVCAVGLQVEVDIVS